MCRHSFPRSLLAAVCLLASSCVSLFAQNYGDLPLSFEPNLGQSAPQVRFLSHGKDFGFLLSNNSATLQLGSSNSPAQIQLTVAHGQTPRKITGEQLLPGKVNYFRGTDETKWLHNLPTYARVRMSSVYPGVDLIYYGNHRELEYDFVVHPGSSTSQVALLEQGADELKLSPDGGLTMKAGPASLHWHAPVAYQQIDGQRKPVAAKYEIAGSTIGFAIGDYDRDHDLVIDPVLVYSTYIGGNGGDVGDAGNAIAVDAAGNAYVAGSAASTNFPTTGSAMQPAPHGNDDAFVAKLNAKGTAYLYSTYLGGGGQDIVSGIAVDSAGEAFVTGQTGSGLNGTSPFPTTAGAYQRTQNPATLNNSVFVARLSANGADLLYSTYLSASNDSVPAGIAIDSNRNAYVLTNTGAGFPVTSGAYQKTAGTHACTYEQFADGQAQVVTKLNATGSALVYSTYVGHGCDYGAAIAVNSSGNAFLTGHTQDAAYPITTGAIQKTIGGVVDGFVTKLNATGSGLVYSTFLGGSLADFSNAIALDASGYAYVAGATDGNFPTTAGAYKTSAINNGYRKGFVTKLSPLGKALVFSTYVIGAGNVSFSGIAVDKTNKPHVTGYTDGKQYPVTAMAVQSTCYASSSGCMTQAVVTELNSTGRALLYSTYFGASDASNNYFPGNIGNAIAVDSSEATYITGRTSKGLKTSSAAESNYPATSSSTSAFAAKFNPAGGTARVGVTIASPTNGSTVTSPVRIAGSAGTAQTISSMQVYVDGVMKDHCAGNTVNLTLAVAAGTRRITVQAIDKVGAASKSTVYVTVK